MIHIFIHCCHMIIILNDYLVHPCKGMHLSSRFLKLEALGARAPLSFVLWIVAKLLRFCLCLFDAIIEFYEWMKKLSMTLSLESESGF